MQRINQQEVWMTKLMEILIVEYGYGLIKINQPIHANEMWLAAENPEAAYSVIRLTPFSIQNDAANLQLMEQIYQVVQRLAANTNKMLCIHVTQEPEEQIADFIDEFCIYENYKSSDRLDSIFPDLLNVLKEDANLAKNYNASIRNVRSFQKGQRDKQNWKKITDVKNWPLAYWVVCICFAVFIVVRILTVENGDVMAALACGAYYKTLIYGNFEYWRIITSGFVHISVLHYICNMMALVSVGEQVEKMYSKKAFVSGLLGSIVIGSLFELICEANTLCVGISGGIYGLIGMLLVNTIETGAIKNKAVSGYFTRLILLNAIISFSPDVSLWCHVGGFVGGVFFGLIFSKKEDWKTLRTNMLVALVIFMLGCGYLVVNDRNYAPIYGATDAQYVTLMEKWGRDSYVKQLDSNLLDYYYKAGVFDE